MARPGATFARSYPAGTPVAAKPNGHAQTWLMGAPVSQPTGNIPMNRLTVQITKDCKVTLQLSNTVVLTLLALLL